MARSLETNANITPAWSDEETLSESQLWMVKSGAISITFGSGSAPALEAGIDLLKGDCIRIESGEVVRKRRISAEDAILAREPKV